MNISNFNIDLNEYNLNDIYNLFSISSNLDNDELKECNNKIEKLKENNIEFNVIDFFQNSYFILIAIKKYRDYLSINNSNYRVTNKDDEYIFQKIKEFPKFNNFNDPLLLINSIIKNDNIITQKNDNRDNLNFNENNEDNQNNQNNNTEILKQLLNEIKLNRVVQVHNNSVSKGEINPIKRLTQLINVHFNSCFRENYYNSNPTNYKYTIPSSGIKNVLSMKLSSIEIPNSWYLFSSQNGNNRFTVEITVCDKCSIYEIVVPDGNYDRDNLVNFLNERYFSSSCNDILKNIEINIDQFTNKTYFKLSEFAPEDLVFSLHFVKETQTDMLDTLGWALGFRLARYLKITDVLQSEGLFDAGGDRYVYLSINDYQMNWNENNIVCFDSMSINENILAKVPLLNGKFSIIINENNSNPLIKIRRYNAPVNINKFDIKLLDKYGNILNLNNMDWSFSLEFETLYENII